ncbi:MAG: hypothetical protein ACLUSP_11380 [Christensenellales bacterium]
MRRPSFGSYRARKATLRRENVCFYTDTTGIWKPVWLEEVGDGYLFGVSALCNYSECEAVVEYKFNGSPTDCRSKRGCISTANSSARPK